MLVYTTIYGGGWGPMGALAATLMYAQWGVGGMEGSRHGR